MTLRLPIALCMLGLAVTTSNQSAAAARTAPHRPVEHAATADTIELAVTGDLMCHASQFNEARTATGYDFRPAFDAIRQHLASADITFGNLETVTAGPSEQFTGYPAFNSPVEYLDAIRDAGFDVLTTANNHTLDRQFRGVERTLDALDARNLLHTGSARSQIERDAPLIVRVKGLQLGVLAYTYGTNGIPMPAGKPFAVNLIDTVAMARDIIRARVSGADAIAVFLHWGVEYERQPNAAQRRVADFLARQDVDLVFGSHPHVLQPAERIRRDDHDTFVIYSMGNFLSGQRQPFTDSGVIVKVSLIRPHDGGPVRIGSTRFVPTYVVRRPRYRIVSVADALQANATRNARDPNFAPGDDTRLRAVWNETTTHLEQSAEGFTRVRDLRP